MLPACRDLYGAFLAQVKSSRRIVHMLVYAVHIPYKQLLKVRVYIVCVDRLPVFSLIRQYLLQHPHRSPHILASITSLLQTP